MGGPSGNGTGGDSNIPTTLPTVTTPPANAGKVVVRRLSAVEYDNTVRDLLGTKLTPGSSFPADDLGAEFDNVGSALSLSPSYVQSYEQAAYQLVDDLLNSTDAARKQKILTCDVTTGGDACAKTILSAFARKAWRRPVTSGEADGLMLPVTTAKTVGAKPLDGLRYGLAGVLMSPFFIFKLELDPDPSATTSRRLSSHELATRLSYSLWSSMPDDALFAAADAGKLSDDADVATQIDRMLADPKSEALLDTFAAEWLDFRSLQDHDVDVNAFPAYTPVLAISMQAEARRFFSEFLRSEIALPGLLNSRFSFLDAPLAGFYGATRAGGADADLTRVDTTDAHRAGLVTMGAFLMTSSLASRTSVVRRGQYVFERMMCGSVPPPPDGIPAFPTATQGLSARQLAEQHRSDPACNGCHKLMDPIGFGLENYDAVGAYRTTDGTAAIDATGMLPDGSAFNGGVELADALAKDPRFVQCFTNKFTTFATGRLMDQKDDPNWISYLSWKLTQAPIASWPTLIRTVLMSDAFRSRTPALQP
jgi:hypothetical protein